MKECSKCKTIKTFSCFHKTKANKDGFCARCKDCRKEKHLENKKDPEWVKAEKERNRRNHLKYKQNPEWVEKKRANSEAHLIRNRKNPEWVKAEKERSKARYLENRDRLLAEYWENIEVNRAKSRERYKNLPYSVKQSYRESPEKQRERAKKHIDKYPEKYVAGIAVRKVKVKTKGNHRHHWSYNEEHYSDIIELSVKDHHKAHRFIKYDQEYMMYRTLEGELLDTKEAHLKYIKECIVKNS